MGSIDLVRRGVLVYGANILHDAVADVYEALGVELLRLDGIVDDFEDEVAHDLVGARVAGEEREADGPCLGRLGAKLVQEVYGLGLELVVGRRVPGDLDGIFNLGSAASQRGLYGGAFWSRQYLSLHPAAAEGGASLRCRALRASEGCCGVELGSAVVGLEKFGRRAGYRAAMYPRAQSVRKGWIGGGGAEAG